MATVTLPKIPSKLVDTAFPPGEPRPPWLLNKRAKRKERPFPAPSRNQPCSKEARGRKRSNRKHRVYGYPSREELAKDRASDAAYLAKKLEDMRRLEEMNRQRYKQLKRAARAGDLALTRDGVFESKPCGSCPANTYHKVASLTEFREPCPGSHMAQHSQNKKGKKAHEEKIIHESFSVTPATSFVPSTTTEMSSSTETSLFSMETCLTTTEDSDEWGVDSEQREEVVYSPAEHMANLVMLDMEEKALTEVLDEEIDAYSKKLQEWSDCQDADVKVEKEAKEKLTSLNTRLQKLDQSGNILVTILHSIDEESQKVMMEREALHIEQKIQEEERILQELLLQQQRELSGEVNNTSSSMEAVESQLPRPTPPPAHLRPSTSYVRPGRRLRRANPDSIARIRSSRTASTMPRVPSSLTTHSFTSSSTRISQQTLAYQSSSKKVTSSITSHAPVTQETTSTSEDNTFSTTPQTSTDTNDSKSHFIACEKKKMQDELRDMLTLYTNMLQADAKDTHSGNAQLLTMVQDFLPVLQETPAESEISTDEVELSQPSPVANADVPPPSEAAVVLESQTEVRAYTSEDALRANDSEAIVGSRTNILASDNDSEEVQDDASDREVVDVTLNSKLDDDNAQDTETEEVTLLNTALDRAESESRQDTVQSTSIEVIQHANGPLEETIGQSEANQSTVTAEFAQDTTEGETCQSFVECEAIPDPADCEAMQTTLSDAHNTANDESDILDTEAIPGPNDSSAVINTTDSEAIKTTAENDALKTAAIQATMTIQSTSTIQDTINRGVVQDALDNMTIGKDTTDSEATEHLSVLDVTDNGVNQSNVKSEVSWDTVDRETLQKTDDAVQDAVEIQTTVDDMATQNASSEDIVSTEVIQRSEMAENTEDSEALEATQVITDSEFIQGTDIDAVEDKNNSEINQGITDERNGQDNVDGTPSIASDMNSTDSEAAQHTADDEVIGETTCQETVQNASGSSSAQDSATSEVTGDTVESEAPLETGDSDITQCTAHSEDVETAQSIVNGEVITYTADVEASEDTAENEQVTTDAETIHETTENEDIISTEVIQRSEMAENTEDSEALEATQVITDSEFIQGTDIDAVEDKNNTEINQDITDEKNGQDTVDGTPSIASDMNSTDSGAVIRETTCQETVQNACGSSTAQDSATNEVTGDTVESEAPLKTGDSDITQCTAHSEDVETAQSIVNGEVITYTADVEASEDTAENEQVTTDAETIHETTENENTVSTEITCTHNLAHNETGQDTADEEVFQDTTSKGIQETDCNQNGIASDVVIQETITNSSIQDTTDSKAIRENVDDVGHDNTDSGDQGSVDIAVVQNEADSEVVQESANSSIVQDSISSEVKVTQDTVDGETVQDKTDEELVQSTLYSEDVTEQAQYTIDNVDNEITTDNESIHIATENDVGDAANSEVAQDTIRNETIEVAADVEFVHITAENDAANEGVAQDMANETVQVGTDNASFNSSAENDGEDAANSMAAQDDAEKEIGPGIGDGNVPLVAGSETVDSSDSCGQDYVAIVDDGVVQNSANSRDTADRAILNTTDREDTMDTEIVPDTGNNVIPDVGDSETEQATSGSDATQGTTTSNNDVTDDVTVIDATESSSNQNRDVATPTIKGKHSAQNFVSMKAFKKYSKAVMRSQSSSGGSRVSGFFLPKKGVSKSLQSLGLLKNKQSSGTQLQGTPQLQQPCKVDLESAGNDVNKTSSTAGVHVPIIKAHSDTKPKSITHKKTRRMSLL